VRENTNMGCVVGQRWLMDGRPFRLEREQEK